MVFIAKKELNRLPSASSRLGLETCFAIFLSSSTSLWVTKNCLHSYVSALMNNQRLTSLKYGIVTKSI